MATRPIDEKIVSMKLNNEDFKRKAIETTNIFTRLKNSLTGVKTDNLAQASKELANISKESNRVDMKGLSSSVDAISNRFSALNVMATTALVNITNRAVNAGLALKKSLTTDQVTAGFSEYETKIGAIGTMLSNTEWEGASLEKIKASLEDLNDYADKTIYSFGNMTESIGRFTAAGVTLDDSTIAIKGLSNLAAASGSNVQQLNTAMYQMSQAMASGTMNLMDWNSLVNAGMGGKKTQDALLATAKSMGVAVDMSEGFRNSISDGWLTSKVFLQTLKQFGEDESMTEAATAVRTFSGMMDALKESIGSGWATTWELIFGDFEQATKFWTAISNLVNGFFAKGTARRNSIIAYLFDEGGITNAVDGIVNVFQPLFAIAGAVKGAFTEIFPSSGGKGLSSFLEGFSKVTSYMRLSEGAISNIKIVFQGLFAIVSMGYILLKSLAQSVLNLVPGFRKLDEGVLSFVANIFKLPIALNNAMKGSDSLNGSTNFLGKTFTALGTVVGWVGYGIVNFGGILKQTFAILSSGSFSEGIFKDGSIFVTVVLSMREGLIALWGYISSIGKGIGSFFDSVASGATKVKNAIGIVINWFKNLGNTIMNNQGWILAGGGIAGVAAMLWKFYETVRDITSPFKKLTEVIGEVGKGVGEVLDDAGGALNSFTTNMHIKSLLLIAVAVGILAVALNVLSKVELKDMGVALMGIAVGVGVLVGALAIFNKLQIQGTMGTALVMIGIATALLIIAKATEQFSGMNWTQITKGIVGIGGVVLVMASAMVVLNKLNATSLGVTALQMLALAGAVFIITEAVTTLSKLEFGDITNGLSAVGGMLLALGAFLRLAKGTGFGPGSAVGIIGIAGAVLMMTVALKSLSKMDEAELKSSLETLAQITLGMALFINSLRGINVAGVGAGLLLLAVALNALLIPIFILGKIDPTVLGQGLMAVTGALVGLATVTNMMGKMGPKGASTILLLAVALNALVIPILALGALGLAGILVGLVGLAGGLGILAGAAILLSPSVPAVLAFAGAISLLGVGLTLVGVGILAFANGLVMLAGLTTVAVTGIVAALGALLVGLVTLIPSAVDLVLKIVTEIIKAVTRMVPKVAEAVVNLVVAILDALIKHLPVLVFKLGEAVSVLIQAVLDAIGREVPKIIDATVEAITEIIVGILTSLANAIDPILEAGSYLILAFLDGLRTYVPLVISETQLFIIDMINGMADMVATNGPALTDAVLRLFGEILLVVVDAGISTIDALFGWIPGVKTATGAIAETLSTTIADNFGAGEIALEKGDDFIKGLSSKSMDAKEAGEGFGLFALLGLDSVDTEESGGFFGSGFIRGIASTVGKVKETASLLAGAAHEAFNERLDIRSPSVVLMQSGEDAGAGIVKGLESSVPKVERVSDRIANAINKYLGIDYKGKDYSDAGRQKGADLASGLAGSSGKAGKAAKKTTDAVKKELTEFEKWKNNLSDLKFFDKVTLKEELDMWNALTVKYKEGSEERKEIDREVYKLNKDLMKEEYNNSKEWISDRLYYDEMSLLQEHQAWKRVQSKYMQGTDERKQADKEVYRTKKELLKKEFNDSKSWISDRLYYNEMSLEQELEAWERVQARYLEGTDERKEADREVYAIKIKLAKNDFEESKKWIAEKLKFEKMSLTQELEAWERIQSRYLEGTDERKEADEEVLRVKTETHNKLLDLNEEYFNLVTSANQTLIDDIQRLRDEEERAISDRANSLANFVGIFDKVNQNSRVSGERLLKNLRGQTETLTNWVSNIQQLGSRGILDQQLFEQLQSMGAGSAAEIAALLTLTDEQLTEYSNLWTTKNAIARAQSEKELEGMRADTERAIQLLTQETEADLEAYRITWEKAVKEIRDGTEKEFVTLSTTMVDIGGNIIEGLQEGMDSMTGPLLARARAIAESISKTIREALDINSPSRVTFQDGKHTVQGLINGIASMANKVKDTSLEVAKSAKDSLGGFMDSILDDNDYEIQVRAVVTYDGLDNNKLESVLNTKPDVSIASRAIESYDRSRGVTQQGQNVDNSRNFSPVTHVHAGASAKEIVKENEKSMRKLAYEFGV